MRWGPGADSYQSLVDEYKRVTCIAMNPNASITAKTEAVSRQMQLNVEYQQALNSLPPDGKQKLMMAWAKAMAEVADGDCP